MHFTCWVDLSHKNLNNKTYHVNKKTMCYHNTQIMSQTSLIDFIQNIYWMEFTWSKKNKAKTSYIVSQIILNKCNMKGNYLCFRLASWGAYMQFLYVFWHIKVCNDPWLWNNFVVVLFSINHGEMVYFLYFLHWKVFYNLSLTHLHINKDMFH